MNKKKKKEIWKKIEISRVELNPEQAVLSCCDQNMRAIVQTIVTAQCVAGWGCEDGLGGNVTSS